MGDPAGVGPEIILKAAATGSFWRGVSPVVVGDPDVLKRVARATGSPVRIEPVDDLPSRSEPGAAGLLRVWSRPSTRVHRPPVGRVDPECGAAAYETLVLAAEAALRGGVDGLVTAPLSKEAIARSGRPFTGHTETLASLSGVQEPVLMLSHGKRRVVHVSCHCSLAEVSRFLTPARLWRTLSLGESALRRLGVARPRVAVCALNPHGGEGGMFGDEEARIIVPVLRKARKVGLDVTGPLPADTCFVNAFRGGHDLVVAMYHDQGHIPFKLMAFGSSGRGRHFTRGVNVTLGLPFVRTSVAHGTAFDIAGIGAACPGSLLDAWSLARKMVRGGWNTPGE